MRGNRNAAVSPGSRGKERNPGNPFGGLSQEIPLISMVVPSLLFEELTLKKPSGEIPRLPAVDSPLKGAARR